VIPLEYIIHKFYQYAGYPRHKKNTNIYEGGCSICREGSSWGRKRRLYFIVKENIICCHNCGWYSTPIKWVREISGMSWREIHAETEEYDYIPGLKKESSDNLPVQQDLPQDCINLFDTHQLRYHRNNQIVKKALDVIAERRLDTAINRPKALYMSLVDRVHKNRLVIPFYNEDNKVSHYQTRSIYQDSTPKYLSKANNEKTLFSLDNLNDPDHIFIFEGPIDSFFVKNSVAVAGIQDSNNGSLTPMQQKQLDRYILSKKVWVLDNDDTGKAKSRRLLEQNECVFIWPRELKMFKDINDLCIHTKRDEITEDFILKHTYCGMKGLVRLKLS
jgi:hypothetical protein